MTTKDGFHWTESTGFEAGIPCDGVVEPSAVSAPPEEVDVVVIGAGHAGLIASRDLAQRGFKVALLEARDRIGGRTWTSVIEGFPYEMGGTWIHWEQPHVYATLSRYSMKDQIKPSLCFEGGINTFTKVFNGTREHLTHDDEDKLFERALNIYFNVDGKLAKEHLPYPHNPMFNLEASKKWDGYSVQDRLNEVKDQLSEDETEAIKALVLLCSGGTLENSGFFDLLRWWGLCGYKWEGINEFCLMYKLKCGQTGLAKTVFQDALTSKNLSCVFSDPVTSVVDSNGIVSVGTTSGKVFKAKKTISTLPLNVLNTVKFSPSLNTLKAEAADKGHIDLCRKLHAEVAGEEYKSWSACTYPGKGLIAAYGDGTTPAGNTHVVAFGCDQPRIDLKDIEQHKGAFLHYKPDLDIKRLVFHDWVNDEFAKGAWCMFSPGFAHKYQAALQEQHGNVHFASADWADGWRGFVDGAIEQGMRAAQNVALELIP